MSIVPDPRGHYREQNINSLGSEQDWYQQMATWITASNRRCRKKVKIETLIALGVTYQELVVTGYVESDVTNCMLLSLGTTIDTVKLSVTPLFNTIASKNFQAALQYNASYRPPGALVETKLDQKENQYKRQKTDQQIQKPDCARSAIYQPLNDKKEDVSVLYVVSHTSSSRAQVSADDALWNLIKAQLVSDQNFYQDALQNIDLFNGLELTLNKSSIVSELSTPSSVAEILLQLAIMLEFEQSLSAKFNTDVKVCFTTEETLLHCIQKNPTRTADHISQHFNCFVYFDCRHLCKPISPHQPTTQADVLLSFIQDLMMKHQTRLYPAPSIVYDSLNNHSQCTAFSSIGRPYLSVDLSKFTDFAALANEIKDSLVFKYSNTQRNKIKSIVTAQHLIEHGIVGMPSFGNKQTYIRICYESDNCHDQLSVTSLLTGKEISSLDAYKKIIGTTHKYIFTPFIPDMDQNNCTFVFLIQKKSQLSRVYTIHQIGQQVLPVVKDWNRNQGGFGNKQLQEDVKQAILSLVRSKRNWEHLSQKTCINVRMIPLGDTFIVRHARIVHPNTTFLSSDQQGDVDSEKNSLTRKKFWEYHADIMAQYFDGKWRQWYSI